MHFSGLSYVALLAIAIALPATAIEPPDATIDATPKLCVVRTVGEWCTIDVQLEWRSSKEQHFCIRKSKQSAVLQCWPSARVGEFLDHLNTTENTHYQLVWLNNGIESILDDDTLTVVHVVPEDRRRARRRKHIWSVF